MTDLEGVPGEAIAVNSSSGEALTETAATVEHSVAAAFEVMLARRFGHPPLRSRTRHVAAEERCGDSAKQHCGWGSRPAEIVEKHENDVAM